MQRRIIKVMVAILAFMAACQAWGGEWTKKGFIYKPSLGARGASERGVYDSGLDRVDARLGKEIWVGDPNYGSTLESAITALGSTQTILRVPVGPHNITANLTVPANITVKPEQGAILAVASGVILTINRLEAGDYQVFSCTGSGKVVWGAPGPAKAVWWGLGTGANDSAALQAAIVACKDGGLQAPVRVGAGTFDLSSATVNFCKGVPVKGVSVQSTIFTSTADAPLFAAAEDLWIDGNDAPYEILTDCKIDLTANTHNIYAVFSQRNMTRSAIRRVNFQGNESALQGAIHYYHTKPDGVTGTSSHHPLFEDCVFRNFKATTYAVRLEGSDEVGKQAMNNAVFRRCIFGQNFGHIYCWGQKLTTPNSTFNAISDPVLQAGGGTGFRIMILGKNSIGADIGGYFDKADGQVPIYINCLTTSLGNEAYISAIGIYQDYVASIDYTVSDDPVNTPMNGLSATYVNPQTVTVSGDKSANFGLTALQRQVKLWWKNESNEQWYNNILSVVATYDPGTGLTTITIPATGCQFSQNCELHLSPLFWRTECPSSPDTPRTIGSVRASQLYLGETNRKSYLTDLWYAEVTANPGSIGAGTSLDVQLTVPGVSSKDAVVVNPPTTLNAGIVMEKAWVSAADTVRVRLYNRTAGAIDPASAAWTVLCFRGVSSP